MTLFRAGVDRLDARDGRVDELGGDSVASSHQCGECRRVVPAERVVHLVVRPSDQCGMRPPLTRMVWPDTKAESSDSR